MGVAAKISNHDILMASESYQQIFDNLATTVATFDEALRLCSVNPAGEALFEVSAKKVVGQKLSELLPHSRQVVKTLKQTLASGHPFTARGVRLSLSNGKSITVDCTVTALSNANGKLILVELSQVDRLLRLARDENTLGRHAANRAVIRGLAHEIKNPLGGLRGAAQLLERELSDRSLKEYTRIVIHEADRLRNLVDRIIGPNKPLQLGQINIHEVLERIRSLIAAEFSEGISIKREYDPSLPELRGDHDQLIQAFLNIARNSAQILNENGIVILRTRAERTFTIGNKSHRLLLRVDIEDNGPGIPEELQEHIFYPMVTGRADGTGLGLSIAAEIINKHGGLIECHSRPRQTVFTIYLPLEGAGG
jgi:two-component system nitrogen regulation sensor histidine kinase GlnL